MFLNLIHEFNLITQGVMFILASIMLCVVWYSKPDDTLPLRVCVNGFVVSLIQIAIRVVICFIISNPNLYSNVLFYILYLLFIACYSIVLCTLIGYIAVLSYKLRIEHEKITIMLITLFAIFFIAMLIPMLMGNIVEVVNGVPHLLRGFDTYLFCGAFTMMICAAIVQINKRTMQKAVYIGVWLFFPFIMIGLLLQYLYPDIVMVSATYVMPFTTLYVLFHCAKFDDTIGCQNDENFFAFLDKEIKKDARYLIVYCRFPLLQSREFSKLLESLVFTTAKACRQIEIVKRRSRVYKKNDFTFITYCRLNEDESEEELFHKLVDIFDVVDLDNGTKISPIYKMIGITNHPYLSDRKRVKALIDYVCDQFSDRNLREAIHIDTDLMKRFVAHNFIDQTLMDINEKADLDDERIICLAQPIYNEAKSTFTTAEVLMRMKVDEQMFFPDQFIPIAEANGYIHMLTRIILNKTCKQIKELEKTHDFSSFSVNCSTAEVQKPGFAEDILSIIKANDVDPKKIRIEITESTEINDYSDILENMKILSGEGVEFFLDDFGTGYSNMERIISFPFTTIKFDKSLLYKALEDSKADRLMKILVRFFVDNGFKVLVEGVEDEDMLEYSRESGFMYVQGYHFSKPVEIERMVEFFPANR